VSLPAPRPFGALAFGGLFFLLAAAAPLLAAAGMPPRALWVWDAANITDTGKRQTLFDLCRRQGVTTLFLYTGSVFLDPGDAVGKTPVTRAQLGQFNLAAHALGLKVHALDGDPAHTLPQHHERVLARLARAIDFNHRQAVGARLDGFQWNIEPHGLALWKNDASSHPGLLRDWLLGSRLLADAARSGSPALPVGFVVPFWLDAPARAVLFEGSTQPPTFHLLNILRDAPASHIAIMAYRDFVSGPGGTLDVSEGELQFASAHAPSVRVWIGQETGDFEPAYITFHQEGPAALDAAMRELSDTLAAHPATASVAGVAIHAHDYYRVMLDAQPSLGDARATLSRETGDKLALRFTRASRNICILETTTDLAAGHWHALATYGPARLDWMPATDASPEIMFSETLAPDGLVSVTVMLPAPESTPDSPARFYRIRAE
jgi:hypothetical protein